MHPDDVFYKRMGSLENLPQLMERKNRFGEVNHKTLGFCMVSASSPIFLTELPSRVSNYILHEVEMQ